MLKPVTTTNSLGSDSTRAKSQNNFDQSDRTPHFTDQQLRKIVVKRRKLRKPSLFMNLLMLLMTFCTSHEDNNLKFQRLLTMYVIRQESLFNDVQWIVSDVIALMYIPPTSKPQHEYWFTTAKSKLAQGMTNFSLTQKNHFRQYVAMISVFAPAIYTWKHYQPTLQYNAITMPDQCNKYGYFNLFNQSATVMAITTNYRKAMLTKYKCERETV